MTLLFINLSALLKSPRDPTISEYVGMVSFLRSTCSGLRLFCTQGVPYSWLLVLQSVLLAVRVKALSPVCRIFVYLQLQQYILRKKGSLKLLIDAQNICCLNLTYSILRLFLEQQNMAYFPSQLQTQPQVLWQPVIVNQLPNQTISQLRRQNDFLKHQLSQVLKAQKITPAFQQTINQFTQPTQRQSFHPQNSGFSTRRPNKNVCFSPRLQPYDNGPSCNRASGLRPFFSPNEMNQGRDVNENYFEESTKLKRMVISKGKDGKYYRDVFKENELSSFIQNNKTMNKFSTAQNSVIFSALTTPTRRSKQINEMFKSSMHQKPNAKRLKSPSFLKSPQRPENVENDQFRNSLIAHLKQQLTISQNQPVFKRSHQVQQSIIESQEEKESKIQELKAIQQAKKVIQLKQAIQRNQSRVPTLQLSYECDSNLSIQRMLRQVKRKKKSTNFSNCDQFLKQIEQNLEAMYGNHQKQ